MDAASSMDALGRLLPSLTILLAALFAVRWWAQRGRGGTGGALRVLARAGVSKGAVVAVVEVGERRFLVGAGEQGVRLLSELEADPGAGAAIGTAAALNGSASHPARPRMAPIDRLRELTVRQPPRRPARDLRI
jgi:flagellar biogenesis protein FliO